MPRVFLNAGEIVFTSRALVVQTILGSCVSVTMRHDESGMAAMCHAALPTAADGGTGRLRYVDAAIDHILRRFEAVQVPADRLQVKLLGGAELAHARGGAQQRAVGAVNLQAAIEQLERRGLAVAAAHTGGSVGRRVLFVTSTGEVFVHSLQPTLTDGY